MLGYQDRVLVVFRAYLVVTLDKQLNLSQIQFKQFLIVKKKCLFFVRKFWGNKNLLFLKFLIVRSLGATPSLLLLLNQRGDGL